MQLAAASGTIMFRIFKSKLLRVSTTYTLVKITNAAVPFLMIPILTRFLSREDYGILAMFQVMVAMLIPVIGLSTDGAVSVKYFKIGQEQFPDFVTACVVIIFTCFLPVSLLILLLNNIISRWTSIPPAWLWIPCVIVLFQGLIKLILAIWQARMKPISYGLFLVFTTITNIGLSVWYVVYLRYDWTGRVLGQLWAGLLFATVSLIIMRRGGLLRLGQLRHHISDAIAFGLPLVPNYVLAVVGAMTGRILINNLIGTEETGLYLVGYQIASILLVVEHAFNLAFIPWLFEKLRKNVYEQKLKIVRFTYVYFTVVLLLALGLGIASPILFPILVGAEFIEASRYVIWFAMAFAFNGMHMMTVNYIFYAEKTVLVTLITVPMVLLNITLSYLFIITRGSIGAAQIQTLISIISFFCIWAFSHRAYPMPWFSMELLPHRLQNFFGTGRGRQE